MTKGAKIVVGAIVAVILVYEFSNSLGAEDSEDDGGDDITPEVGDSLPTRILDALASFENVDPKYNNPGALGKWDGSKFNITAFSSLAAGYGAGEALAAKFLIQQPTLTVAQFVSKWESGSTNPKTVSQALQNYIDHVADKLGIGANDPISDAGGGDDDEDDSTDDE